MWGVCYTFTIYAMELSAAGTEVEWRTEEFCRKLKSFFFCLFFFIQLYVPFKIILAHNI